jgi:uncharacterized protein YfaS (alpha-2-macroglobulin family)
VPDDEEGGRSDLEGYVKVSLGDDRALASVSRYDPDLSPWRFDVGSAWGDDRLPLAGAVFTERGIYRPGERVYAKAIVRDGPLGALRVPAPTDSLRWIFHDREDGVLRQRTLPLSAFGTADQSLQIPAGAPVGYYRVEIQARRQGDWHSIAQAGYRVAEYRPPEFLVQMAAADSATRLPGDRFAATVQARYLFGAPMARATITWSARATPVGGWALEIPGLDEWYVGDTGAWWEEDAAPEANVFASGVDTLDARGERTLGVKVHGSAVSVVVTTQRSTVSATHSPTSCERPSRSRRTRCHSRRTTVPCTRTPATLRPSGLTASTPTDCATPPRQK